MDFDRLVEELGAVLAAPDLPRLRRAEPGADKKWQAGDLAAQIPSSRQEEAADRLDISLGTLRSYIEVARAFPPERRTVRAAWAIYREFRTVAPEEREHLFRDGLTLRAARLAIGKGPMDRPKKDRMAVEDRAWEVIEELQDADVRDIVMREMNSSVNDRRARKAARMTVDEISARKKLIDAEVRRQKKTPTVDQRFWQVSKELTEASQFVYAVARLYNHHRDTMSEERWGEIVKILRNVGNGAEDVADRIEGLSEDGVIDSEAFDDDYLALGMGESIADAEIIGESS